MLDRQIIEIPQQEIIEQQFQPPAGYRPQRIELQRRQGRDVYVVYMEPGGQERSSWLDLIAHRGGAVFAALCLVMLVGMLFVTGASLVALLLGAGEGAAAVLGFMFLCDITFGPLIAGAFFSAIGEHDLA
jgi:hypothetical protein